MSPKRILRPLDAFLFGAAFIAAFMLVFSLGLKDGVMLSDSFPVTTDISCPSSSV
jgi:hypothetical protein